MKFKRFLISMLSALTIASPFALVVAPVYAATVSTPATANVSSDTAVSGSVSLPALVITEQAAGDILIGTLTFGLPSGYVFDTTSVANVSYSGAGLTGSSTVAFISNTGFSFEITATSTVAGSVTVGSGTPLKVKASAGTPIVAAGNILLTSGNLTGLASTTSFGLLTQVPGAANKLNFTVQPPSTSAAGATFSLSVGVKDQFGNAVSSDNGRPINLVAKSAADTSVNASSTLNGSVSVNTNAGVATFNGLSYPQGGTIIVLATSSPLTSILSNVITVTTATSTASSTPTTLPNGTLVKFTGDPTIYIAVNGELKPFTSANMFLRRGRKFEHVKEWRKELKRLYRIGRAFSDDDEDDHHSVTPPVLPAATSTPPNVTGLPDGSVVKVAGNPTVYIVLGGVLRPIPSLLVFKAFKKDFKDIKVLSASELTALSLGQAATFPDGTLVQGTDKTVYVVEGGQLYGIPNMNVLKRHGWSLGNLFKIDKNEFKKFKHGGTKD